MQICFAIVRSCKTDKHFPHTCLIPPLISDVSFTNQLTSDCNVLLNVKVKAARRIYINLVGISEEGLFGQQIAKTKTKRWEGIKSLWGLIY